jgi:hypothetical protein
MPGVAVFVLRERAGHLHDQLCTELLREGWLPLDTVHLDGDITPRVADEVRGGNWGQGPWAVGGGGPVAYVVAYDLSKSVGEAAVPWPVDRVQHTKLAIRDRLLDAQPPGAPRYNPLHSSDDPRQALDYLRVLGDPNIVARIQRRIGEMHAAMVFPYPVVKVLPSLQRRAVTAVVQHPEFGECVCKLFYPTTLRFLEREVRARTEFADLPETPDLLEAGDNYLLTPRYSDTRAHVRRRLPGIRHVQLTPRTSVAMARLARDLHERGVFVLDLATQNLVTDPVHGLKVLDWEFLQDQKGEKPPLAASPTVLGWAAAQDGLDSPVGGGGDGETLGTLYRPLFTGVPIRVLLHGPTWLTLMLAEPGMVVLHALRTVWRAAHGTPRRAKRTVRKVLDRLEGRTADQ